MIMDKNAPTFRIALIGFGSFAHHVRNPSGEIATQLHGQRILGAEIHGISIPTSWTQTKAFIHDGLMKMSNFDAIIGMGVSDDNSINFETVARNKVGGWSDIHGLSLPSGCIVEDGPETYSTSIPFAWLKEELEKLSDVERKNRMKALPELDILISENAGDYLCNYLFYLMAHHLKHRIPYIGFIHLPPLSIHGRYTHHGYQGLERSLIRVVSIFVRWLSLSKLSL